MNPTWGKNQLRIISCPMSNDSPLHELTCRAAAPSARYPYRPRRATRRSPSAPPEDPRTTRKPASIKYTLVDRHWPQAQPQLQETKDSQAQMQRVK